MTISRIVRARVPAEIQDAANQVIQASGLTVSHVVRVLMARIAQDNAIPPALFQPGTETLAAFNEAEGGKLQRFENFEALWKELLTEE